MPWLRGRWGMGGGSNETSVPDSSESASVADRSHSETGLSSTSAEVVFHRRLVLYPHVTNIRVASTTT